MEGTCQHARFQKAVFYEFIGVKKRKGHNLGYGLLLADREEKSIYAVVTDRWIRECARNTLCKKL
jgi:hypothetical protein